MRNQHQTFGRFVVVGAAAIALSGAARAVRLEGLGGTSAAQSTPVAMFVSVLDKSGAPVPSIAADEFVVRENGVRREVLKVSHPATDPIDIALLVDNTQAATRYQQDIRQAVWAFVEAVHKKNLVSLVTFADRPTVVVKYTHDLAELKAGLPRMFPVIGSGSYLLDAIIEVGKDLAKRKAERAVIVVVSAEGPELGNYSYEDVLSALSGSGAALTALVLNPRASAASNDATKWRAISLDRGPRESGGVRYDLITSMDLTNKMKLLATQLDNQYRVVYARPESLIPPDKFDVSVTRPDLEAHGTPVRPQSR